MFNTNEFFEKGKITILMDAQAGSSGKGKIGSFITEHADNWTFACLHHSTRIQTEDGVRTIKWVVDNKYTGKVLSMGRNGKFVFESVLRHSKKTDKSKKWVRIKTNITRSLIECTADHECAFIDDVFDPANIKYTAAINLRGKYLVGKPEKHKNSGRNLNGLYNGDQLSALCGVLLGDGHIDSSGRIVVTHGPKQFEYLEMQQKLFGGNLTEIKSGKNSYSKNGGFRLDGIVTPQTKKFRHLLYNSGRKSPLSILGMVNEISLSYWYMDDGWLRNPGGGRRPSIGLSTCGFTEGENVELCNFFNNRFGLNPTILKKMNGKYCVLVFNVDDSERFLNMVHKYIPECMEYKLPEQLRGGNKIELNNKLFDFGVRFVTSVDEVVESKFGGTSALYDIEVENTHNFLANGYVVHNCNAFFPNAGHWVRTDDRGDYFYQTLNSCAYQSNFKNNFEAMYIGPGAIIELPALFHELEANPGSAEKLRISPLAVILQEKDTLFERGLVNFEGEPFNHDGTYRYGSTSHGVGAANARRVLRRKDVIYAKDVAELAPFICDTTREILDRLGRGESGLLEVAQGFQLSLLGRFAPNCTSRNVTAVQALSDMMLPPSVVGAVVFNFRTFPIRINSNKYVGEDGTHLTWEQVQSGMKHTVLRGDSGGWYPDQREITWEELTALSGSPEKIMEITSVTKLPRRVATFSKQNAQEVFELNYFGEHVKYFASINFVNYLDHKLTGLRRSNSDERYSDALSGFSDWYFENIPGCYDDYMQTIILGTGPKTDDVVYF